MIKVFIEAMLWISNKLLHCKCPCRSFLLNRTCMYLTLWLVDGLFHFLAGFPLVTTLSYWSWAESNQPVLDYGVCRSAVQKFLCVANILKCVIWNVRPTHVEALAGCMPVNHHVYWSSSHALTFLPFMLESWCHNKLQCRKNRQLLDFRRHQLKAMPYEYVN